MFTFKKFQHLHLASLRTWLKEDHVKPFWQESSDDEKLKIKFLEELPLRSVHSFVILLDQSLIGYIQYYDAKKVGGGWWIEEPAGTFGIDLMIGAVDFIGHGLGTKVIVEFISFVLGREDTVKSIIIDPDPQNLKAIRAFEKAGFVREAEIKTPSGQALLMRMKIDGRRVNLKK